ncbi:phosphate ABC transporter permease subunit PstC [Proteinivorax hydrogeniformans]|uniref:Phosphate transport system permease protein n=1 Tax=Proteinivorax hydrogeniformans TaxID=1826727 RepID=A0AAU8HWA3_9FIRM
MAKISLSKRSLELGKCRNRQYWREWFVLRGLTLSGLFAIAIITFILGFLIKMGMPAISEIGLTEFLLGKRWMPTSPQPGYGALPQVLGTIVVAVGALVIALPWGVSTALYLSEIANSRVRNLLKPMLEVLASIPSVVFGFIALVVVAPAVASVFGLSNGLTALTGAIMLGVMALPTITSISEDALKAVPNDYRDAALALGADDWQTMTKVTLPAAKSGIVASIMLGFGRAVGETMTVLMATGNAIRMPLKEYFGVTLPDYLSSVRTLTATIAIEGSDVPWGSLHYHSLFVLGALLFILTFIINLIADIVLNKGIKGGN